MRVPVFLIFSFLIMCFSSALMASENIEKAYTSAPALNRVSDYVVSIDNKHVYVASDQSTSRQKKQNTTIFKLEIGDNEEFTRKSYYTFDSDFMAEQDNHFKIIPFAQDHILVTSSEYLFVMDTSGSEITLKYSYDLTTPEWQTLSKGIHYAEYSPYHNKIIGLTDVIQYVDSYGVEPDNIEPFNTMLFSLRIEENHSLAIDAVYDNQAFSQTYKPHTVAVSDTGRIFVGHSPDDVEICFDIYCREKFIGTDTGEAVLSEFSLTDNTFTLQSTFLDSNQYTANSSVITTIKLHNNQLFAYDSGAGNVLIVDVSPNIKLEQIISDDIPQFAYTKWAALGTTQGQMDINKDASLIAVSDHKAHAFVYQMNDDGVFIQKGTYKSPLNETGQCLSKGDYISAANKVLFMPDGSTLIKEQQNCENSYAGLYVLSDGYVSSVETTELISNFDSYLRASKIYSNQQGQFLIEGYEQLLNTEIESDSLTKAEILWRGRGSRSIPVTKYVNSNKELIIRGNEGGVHRLSLNNPDSICSAEEFGYNYPYQILSSPDARFLFISDWISNQAYGEDARYSGVVQIFKAEENEGGYNNCFTSIMTSSVENSISWEEARQVQSVALGSSFITKLGSTNAFAVFQLNQNSGEFETKPNITLNPELESEFVAAKADNNGEYLFIFTKTLGIQKYKWNESSATITYDSTINYSFQGELTSVEKFSSSVSTPLVMLHLQYKDLSDEQSSEFQVLNLNAIDAYYEYYDFDGIATADGLTDVDISSDGKYIAGVNNTQELVHLYELGPLDSDGDGVLDDSDAFPSDPNEYLDTDGDGIGNNADTDDDGDGVPDPEDAFPLDATESVDTDGDGIGNNADTDDDGDSVPDTEDAFPLDATESVDTDGDGIGNNADQDDDGDGVLDSADAYPLDASRSSIPVDETNNSSSGGSFSVYLLMLIALVRMMNLRVEGN